MLSHSALSLSPKPSAATLWVDQLGAGLSLACAAHCMATPLLLSLLPFVGLGFLADESVETLLLGTSLVLAVGSLCWGFRIHHQRRTLLLLGAALLLIVGGRLSSEETTEVVSVVLGAGLLACGHLLNRHLCKTCLQCQDGPMDSDVVLQTANLSVGYGNFVVLGRVNLTIRAGELWFVLGRNGSGKTTLLHALLGLLEPQTGRLHRQVANGVGFVPQRCDINPTLPITIREFVGLGLVGTGLNRATQLEYLDRALSTLDLDQLGHKNYWTLSGGQRQRALVARALVRRPALLILDEPTNNLDLAAEGDFLQTLTDIHEREHNTCLFVTHNLGLAERYATHIGLVAQGTVIAGPKSEVLNESNLDRVYGRGQRIHLHVSPEGSSDLHSQTP
jgi:ABC-type Mn2+/Zn2+ transport system ATPase subunit